MLIGMRVAQIQKLLYTLNESKRTKARAALNPLRFILSRESRTALHEKPGLRYHVRFCTLKGRFMHLLNGWQ